MKKNLSFIIGLCAVFSLTACNNQDAAMNSVGKSGKVTSSSELLQLAPGNIQFVDSPTLTEIDLGALPTVNANPNVTTPPNFAPVNIKNSGGLPLTVLNAHTVDASGNIDPTDANITLYTQCLAPLAAGASCSVILQLAPYPNVHAYTEMHMTLRVSYGDSLGHTGSLDLPIKSEHGIQANVGPIHPGLGNPGLSP